MFVGMYVRSVNSSSLSCRFFFLSFSTHSMQTSSYLNSLSFSLCLSLRTLPDYLSFSLSFLSSSLSIFSISFSFFLLYLFLLFHSILCLAICLSLLCISFSVSLLILFVGKNKGIIDNPIVLTIYATQCPDLSLIDLPGITRVPLKGSDQSEDIEMLTRQMALRYDSIYLYSIYLYLAIYLSVFQSLLFSFSIFFIRISTLSLFPVYLYAASYVCLIRYIQSFCSIHM